MILPMLMLMGDYSWNVICTSRDTSFKDAFTSSPYPKQKIESLVSTLKSEGYDTSFSWSR
jgi:hypothetical protein